MSIVNGSGRPKSGDAVTPRQALRASRPTLVGVPVRRLGVVDEPVLRAVRRYEKAVVPRPVHAVVRPAPEHRLGVLVPQPHVQQIVVLVALSIPIRYSGVPVSHAE